MLNTIKSKILLITTSMLVALILVLGCFAYIYYKNSKELVIWSCSHRIGEFAGDINKEVIKIEANSKDLALFGELYYRFDRKKDVATKSIIQVFENYKDSLGGGIWFKPYLVDPAKKYSCIYAYRNKDGKVISDPQFETAEYDYLNKSWYKEIMSQITPTNNIAWSLPYYEKEGSNTLMVTAGSGIYDINGKLVGISTVDWEIKAIVDTVKNMKPTPNSFALFGDTEHDYTIVSTDPYINNAQLSGKSLSKFPWYNKYLKNVTYMTYHGKKYIPYVKHIDNGMIFIVNVPKFELFRFIALQVGISLLALIIISSILTALLYSGLKNNIIKPIGKLIHIANKISQGANDIEIKIEKPEEFAKLASTFDKMTKDIKEITKERAKINSELSIAKSIQESSLPNVFPPFPDKNEFDIFASMEPAKEVGGDFYDFYFIDQDNFMFLIADVSGKGVPAALFMMTSKTLINNLSQLGFDPQKLIETINKKICENNKHGYFITMFSAIVNIKTGKMTCINCGHNPPLLMKAANNGNFEFLKLDSNIVLGIFENAQFNISEIQLEAGDKIFTYTDGITEAINDENQMYGEKQLQKVLNNNKNSEIKQLAGTLRQNLHDFTNNTPQSDDITMLIFKYNGNKTENVHTYKNQALKENYSDFCNWLKSNCTNLNCELMNKIEMCAEEIFANICFYAYPEKKGNIEVKLTNSDNSVVLEFTDNGIPYNPLKKADPDITTPPMERPLGGLGIFMIKQMAENIEYHRENDQNILSIKLS